MMKLIILLELLLAAFALPPALSAAQSSGSPRVVRDLLYGRAKIGRHPGYKELRLDLFQPAQTGGPTPVVILLHGGGFQRGSKDGGIADLALRLSERGLAAATINYRLIPDQPPPIGSDPLQAALQAAREDARQAIEWVRANASEYELDFERLAIGGSSAGAITALFVAYKDNLQEVKAVVNLWGGLYGSETAISRGDPPLLTIHGMADEVVPFSLAEAIQRRARETGLDFQFYGVEGAGHGFAALPPSTPIDGRSLADRVADFLLQKLHPQ